MKPVLVISTMMISLATAANAAEPLAGYDRFPVKAAHRAEPLAASIWYPVGTPTYKGLIGDDPVFKGTYAYVGAAPETGKHPLVLLSHGSGGNMDALSWLSSELAKHGAMVLAVNHPGTTSGDSSPRRTVLLKDRAEDLGAALDAVLKDSTWAPLIDQSRIVGFGFSLGGATALGLAGARFDRVAYKDYCDRLAGDAVDCAFLAKGGVDLEHLPDQFAADMRDVRVSEAMAVDPGFTYAMTDASIRAMTMPVLLINLGRDNRFRAADLRETGSNLVGRLSDVTYDVFAPAHHFTFLAECQPGAKQMLIEEGEDPICDDPAGTDRAMIHQKIIDSVLKFLKL